MLTLRIFPLYSILQSKSADGTERMTCTCGYPECRMVGKHPMVRWRDFDENTKGPASLDVPGGRELGGNYGVILGRDANLFVVDLDIKGSEDGLAALEALGEVPDTLVVATPSGGFHLYFEQPPASVGTIRNSVRKLGPGIDIRGEGGFVVGPDSYHKSGGQYRIVDPGVPVAKAPDWLVAACLKAAPAGAEPRTAPAAKVILTPEERERRRERARKMLERQEPAVEGSNGSTALFVAARKLVRYELPLEDAEELLLEAYNPRCQPPWTPRELRHKLEDADRIDTEPRGAASDLLTRRLRGEVDEPTAARKQPDPKHEYTFHPGNHVDGEDARGVSIGELTSDLHHHVDWDGVWAYDEFRDQCVATNPPLPLAAEKTGLTDYDVEGVRTWFEKHGKKARSADVHSAIVLVSRTRSFHSVRDYLRGLRWDGVKRLDRMLPTYFASKDEAYERAIGPRWMIALVARVMQPGCQADCTLVLQGPQGYGKSAILRALVPNPAWYTETSTPIGSKDFYEVIRGVWLYCFDELDSLNRGEITKVKSVLTALADRYRKAYGRMPETILRQNGFAGTTNKEVFLDDPSGARRFWPVAVSQFLEVERLKVDRDQLWAEAFVRYQAGEVWHVDTPVLRALCEAEQEARTESADTWDDDIAAWLNNPAKVSLVPVAAVAPVAVTSPVAATPGAFGGVAVSKPYDASRGVTTAAVLEFALEKPRGQVTRSDAMRVGAALRRIGWGKIVQHIENGAKVRRYTRG